MFVTHGFSAKDEEAPRKVWNVAELGAGDESVLDASVFDLSVLLWTHEGRAQSKSAIVHFSAVFGIDNHRGCHRPPPVYGQILAALFYRVRSLLFEHALRPLQSESTLTTPSSASSKYIIWPAIVVDHLRRFVNELCDYADSVLCQRLLFSTVPDEHWEVNVKKLVHDVNETSTGYPIVFDPRN
ncbi:hypothetical protein LTR54_018109 [Friedmanniomyces endolithicus]|nr:hypothetical protein LTR54_018109 [Friedmanniomyces endolithicus]